MGRYSLATGKHDHLEGNVDHPLAHGEPGESTPGRPESFPRRRARDRPLELEDRRDHRERIDRISILVDGLQPARHRLVYPAVRHTEDLVDLATSATGWRDLVPRDELGLVRKGQTAQESGRMVCE